MHREGREKICARTLRTPPTHGVTSTFLCSFIENQLNHLFSSIRHFTGSGGTVDAGLFLGYLHVGTAAHPLFPVPVSLLNDCPIFILLVGPTASEISLKSH